MMLCDDLCIKEERLARAVNVFDAFRDSYCDKKETVELPKNNWFRWLVSKKE